MQGSFPPTVVGFAVLVQSSFKDPPQLEASARSFLDGFVGNLSHMPKEKFGEHKVSLLAQIEEKEVSMGEETARLWKEILIKRYQWDRKERLAAELASIDLPQLAIFARTLVDVPRHSLSVGIYGQGRDPPRELLAPGDVRERIWSMASFKGLPPPYWGLELPASPASAGQHKQMR
jgi:secreted Zn-dependent insulinase-like peptidase